jgi:hypothetical protein
MGGEHTPEQIASRARPLVGEPESMNFPPRMRVSCRARFGGYCFMRIKSVLASMAVCAAIASPAAAATTVIDFDDAVAPAAFSDQTPLTNQYAALGVTFAGVGFPGAEVLDQDSNFGVGARSGRNFLAHNTYTGLATEAIFATAISGFEVFVGSGAGYDGLYWANGYNLAGDLVDAVSIQFAPGNAGGWTALNLSGAGITRVQFGSSNLNWLADDLSFSTAGSAVPEPATWAMMITGFGLAGTALRRRRSALAA